MKRLVKRVALAAAVLLALSAFAPTSAVAAPLTGVVICSDADIQFGAAGQPTLVGAIGTCLASGHLIGIRIDKPFRSR